MKEFRCEKCNKLLFKYDKELTTFEGAEEVVKNINSTQPVIAIKCPRCNEINTLVRTAIVL